MDDQKAKETRPRLILVDGHSLAHRAYFALFAASRRFATADGRPTGAVYGFLSMLLTMIERYAPTHMAVVFDAPGPTFRHERFEEYKAQRPGLASELGPQIDAMRDLLRALAIPVYQVEGYEADDVLGTIACRASAAGQEVLIVTGDRDALQLVDDRIRCVLTVKGVTETAEYDPAAVREQYGIEPALMRDVKALMGDTSDNVPGVRGIGEKTALSLVQAYGPLEAIYARLGEIRGAKVPRLLEEGREQAFMSRELVTINCDAPVDLALADLARSEPHHAELAALLESLEFRSLVKRIYPKGLPALPAASDTGDIAARVTDGAAANGSAAPPATTITYLETQTAIRAAAAWLAGCELVAVELAREGSRPSEATITAIGLAGRRRRPRGLLAPAPGPETETRAYAIAVRAAVPDGLFAAEPAAATPQFAEPAPVALEERAALAALGPLLSSPVPKVMHDAKPALVILGSCGVRGCGVDEAGWVALPGLHMDTAVAAYLIDPARARYELDRLAAEFLRVDMAAGAGDPARRALVLLDLAGPLQAELVARRLEPLWRDVELPLVTVLARMELVGVRLDMAALGQMDQEFSARLMELTREVHELARGGFNINSTRQLAEVLYERLGLPSTKKTAKGKVASVDAETLESLADRHAIVPLVLEHRSLSKLKGTYIDGLRALVDPLDGRIRTVFHQTVASTGRLSSTEPNLQNIPIREEMGRRIRRAFVASGPDHILLAADYSQIELRVLAHLSEDPVLMEAFRLDQDIHRRTAAEVFGVPLGDVTGAMRQAAKAVNFGIIYGISDFGLARNLGVSRAEAGEYIAQYFARYRRVDEFFRETIAEARRLGYVTTVLGRRRALPDLYDNNYNIRAFGERTARNTPIQGSAADIIKLAMVALDREIAARGWRGRMVLQVHDELLFDLPRGELAAVGPVVEDRMQKAFPLRVPLKVDIRAAANWYEAK
jgi:DNA polymerase-1